MNSSDHQAIVRDDSDVDVRAQAEAVMEYEWPVNSGEYFFIEEYLGKFLGIKSLRRAYPLIERRKVQTLGEREFLLEKRVVTELQCDLGVIAIHEQQVYDFIVPDFQEEFDIWNGRKLQMYYEEIVAKASLSQIDAMGSLVPTVDDLKTCAAKACASWNSKMNEDSNKFRFKYLDLQTQIFHRRKRQQHQDCYESTKIGSYPVAVVPGQYVDYVPRFSSEYLKRLPLNTVLVDPSTPFELTPIENGEEEEETMSAWSIPNRMGDGDNNSMSSSSSTITCGGSEFDGDTSSTTCDTLFEELIAV